ncbi:zinc-binding dehydrogenase [Streptomyces sp. UH6]|uniref:zinc-binding dehydrogenase n=1 Tax=Streptomyces sp. UH6 TaxID=2748379 RepID=UPI0015D4FF34|nr:zinc-binding dehydrogenase [Streptomyces sp. UH6]NYV75661.1 zinc-binding dehydrogenase [Streptomyces sp. UH6]
MSRTMLAGRMNFATRTFEVKEVPLPDPGPGEVRVRVRAAGVCLSDVHLIEGLLRPMLLQGDEVTLGHEVAGEVDVPGEGVTGAEPGTRVIVGAGKRVGEVVWTMGVDYDGGWAEYVVAPAEVLLPIPDSLPFEQAAVIPDAVSTPWAAVEWTGQVKAGEAVGVWGIGGLGAHGVQLLRFAGAAPIVAVDPVEAARERALEFGADLALDPADPDFDTRIAAATRGAGLDAAIDFAGVAPVRDQALRALGTGGRLVLVGISGGALTVENDGRFQYARKRILGHYGSEPRHVADLVRLVELGRLDFSRSVSGTLPLADAAQAVETLESKKGNPIRLVLIP